MTWGGHNQPENDIFGQGYPHNTRLDMENGGGRNDAWIVCVVVSYIQVLTLIASRSMVIVQIVVGTGALCIASFSHNVTFY